LRWLPRLLIVLLLIAIIPEAGSAPFQTHLRNGDQASADRRFGDALLSYQRALDVLPDDPVVLRRLVNAALGAQRPALADSYLRALGDYGGWRAELYRQRAAILGRMGTSHLSRIFWQASLDGSRSDLPTLRQLTELALTAREWNVALGYLRQRLAIDPRDEWTLYTTGLLLAPSGPAEAWQVLTLAAADPQYRPVASQILDVLEAHGSEATEVVALRLGLTLLNAGEYAAAEQALTLAAQPPNPVTLAFLGLVRDQQGRDGFPLIAQALTLVPDDPQVNYVAAVHYRLAGQLDLALAILNNIGSRDPRSAAIAVEIGTIHRMRGRFTEALDWFKLASALAPDEASFAALLSSFYADEDLDLAGEGVQVMANFAQRFPDNSDIAASYGWALFRSGDPVGARAQLERAVALQPTSVRARYYFGAFLVERGDLQSAIESLLYVVHNAADDRFREQAARTLERLGYRLPRSE
jgi:tetratricopeptide (TPR) repeat protein